jgi:hypothetical protein
MASSDGRLKEASLTARLSSLLLLAALLAAPASAKDKKKSPLPNYVLSARTVLVVIDPNAGEPVDEPTANYTARENVERALQEWGRLRPVLEGQEPDLVITVKTGTGKLVQRSIKGGPMDNRPGVAQPTDGGIRVGAQQGHPPPLGDPGMGPQDTGPHTSNEIGKNVDTFEVFQGGVPHPLDSAPVWRYMAKDCLRAPDISAVEAFRKAIAEAEQSQSSRKP